MQMVTFKRDKRSPKPLSKTTSVVMSAIKAKDTRPEIIVRKALWVEGLRGYRLHSSVAGRADICFPSGRVAIFIHGCYWHRCPQCDLPLPKHNRPFWVEKFTRNVQRDKDKVSLLEQRGWKVLSFWECEVNRLLPKVIQDIRDNLRRDQ